MEIDKIAAKYDNKGIDSTTGKLITTTTISTTVSPENEGSG